MSLQRETWQQAWKNKSFRIQFLLTLAFLGCIGIFIPHFFEFIQQRNGKVLNDPLLRLLAPKDFSLLTFILIYSGMIVSLAGLLSYPELLLRTIQAYCLLTLMRIACISLVPLNEPPGMILLSDPFVGVIGYGGKVITKDLFFSGHTSTLTLLILSVSQKWLKIVLCCITITVASLILIQHVHYMIDVLAAPLFAAISWWICFRKLALL